MCCLAIYVCIDMCFEVAININWSACCWNFKTILFYNVCSSWVCIISSLCLLCLGKDKISLMFCCWVHWYTVYHRTDDQSRLYTDLKQSYHHQNLWFVFSPASCLFFNIYIRIHTSKTEMEQNYFIFTFLGILCKEWRAHWHLLFQP